MYQLLKIGVRLGLLLYCKRLRFAVRPQQGPALLACNHPNSFFDALVVATQYPHPVHFLARGDVFRKPWVARLLRFMKMIPIHRLSEGRAGLQHNEQSFRESLSVLEAGGTLLIFAEGICKNEWILRPLKKGAARLAYAAWEEKGLDNLVVKPLSFSYSTFTSLPLSVAVTEGAPISRERVGGLPPPLFYQQFNAFLQGELEAGLLSAERVKGEPTALYRKRLLALPALLGWLTHRPLYLLVKKIAMKKTTGTVFYHSVLFGLLLFIYPIVLVIVTTLIVALTNQPFFWILLLVLPFTAWCYKEYRG